ELVEVEEENSAEDGYFAELEKVNKAEITKRIKEIKGNSSVAELVEAKEELAVLTQYLNLLTKQTEINKKIKQTEKDLDNKLYAKYPTLTEDKVKQLVVDDKWMHNIETAVKGEIDHISQRLTNRIKELAERYESTLGEISLELSEVEAKVNAHLEKMGFKL
ncbi:MAG: hypothetical protein KAG95_04695, partial [Bacteroidales bacterium]|nr:hypothetical protein [Bacteroidales bacterium]